MRSAYVAALGSYAARANASWTGRALVGSNLVMAGATAAWSSAEPNLAQSMLMPTAFLAGLLFLHFKECATVPPAGTWPGYRRAHALAAATLAVAVCIAWPAAVTVRTGWPGVGLVATMLALTAAVAWFVLTQSAVATIVALGGWFGLLHGMGAEPVRGFLLGTHPRAAWAVAAAAALALATVVLRIATLTEDDSLYHRRTGFGGWSTRPRMTGDVNRAWVEARRSAFFTWPDGVGTRRLAALATAVALDDVRGLARRWRALTPGAPVMALVIAVCATLPALLQWGDSTGQQAGGWALLLLHWLLLMPAMIVSTAWLRQWRFLEADSLRPIGRGAFVRSLGLALAVQIGQAWAGAAAVVTAVALIGARVGGHDAHAVGVALAGSALVQVLAFGVVCWTLRFRSPAPLVIGLMVAVLPVAVVMAMTLSPRFAEWRSAAFAAPVLAAGVGVWLARDAARRWELVEVG